MFVYVWQVGVKDNGVFWMDWDEQLGFNRWGATTHSQGHRLLRFGDDFNNLVSQS